MLNILPQQNLTCDVSVWLSPERSDRVVFNKCVLMQQGLPCVFLFPPPWLTKLIKLNLTQSLHFRSIQDAPISQQKIHNISPFLSASGRHTDETTSNSFIYTILKKHYYQSLGREQYLQCRGNKSSCFCIPDSRVNTSLLSSYKKIFAKMQLRRGVSEGGMWGLFRFEQRYVGVFPRTQGRG